MRNLRSLIRFYCVMAALALSLAQGAVLAQAEELPPYDGWPPEVWRAVVDGNILTVTFSEQLDAASTPVASDFLIHYSGQDPETDSGTPATAARLLSSGRDIALTLPTALVQGDESVVLGYRGPDTGGRSSLRDLAGNEVESFRYVPAWNITGDVTAPVLRDLHFDGSDVHLTYFLYSDGAADLDHGSTPDPSAFSVTADGIQMEIYNVALGSYEVLLQLTEVIDPAAEVFVTYDVPASNPIQDFAGNRVVPIAVGDAVNPVREGHPPTGTVKINGGAAYSTSGTVSVAVPATDAGSGVAKVALSNNDASWATYTYTTPISWSLTNTRYGGSSTNGTRTVYAKWQDAAGNWSEVKSDTIFLDTVLPVASAPASNLVVGTQLGTSTIPVKVSWAAATDTGGSGVTRYALQQKRGTGSWTNVTLPTALTRSITRSLAPGTYQFQVRAQDKAGNWSTYKQGASFVLSTQQETSTAISYTGTWTRAALTGAYGGYVKHASASTARAKLTFTGKQVQWASTRGPNRGRANVYIDGVKVTTVDLYSSATKTRQAVYTRTWTSSGTHTLEVRVLGTKNAASTATRVDVDAFTVLK